MDHLNDVPLPRPISAIMLTISLGGAMLREVDPTHLSGWLSSAAGVCALVSYGHRFYKWTRKKANERKKTTIK